MITSRHHRPRFGAPVRIALPAVDVITDRTEFLDGLTDYAIIMIYTDVTFALARVIQSTGSAISLAVHQPGSALRIASSVEEGPPSAGDEPEACDELSGGWPARALLCKVYKR